MESQTADSRGDFSFRTTELQGTLSNASNKESAYPDLHSLIEPHLASYNAILEQSLLNRALFHMEQRVILDGAGNRIRFWLEDPKLDLPSKADREYLSPDCSVYPRDCRVRGTTYASKLTVSICYQINEDPIVILPRQMGMVPVMVKSNLCHFYRTATPQTLAQHREDTEEIGGYFIVNGIEKIVRMLLATRANYPLAIVRSTFPKKGEHYSDKGILIRSVRSDLTSQGNTLHYLTNGTCTLRFYMSKNEYILPIFMIMRALKQTTDKEIFDAICQHKDSASMNAEGSSNNLLARRVEHMLRMFHASYNMSIMHSRHACLQYIGSRFASILRNNDALLDSQRGELLLKKMILVHLSTPNEKFNMLAFMIRKLLAFTDPQQPCCADNIDSPSMQEVLLPGQLIITAIKDKLEDFLTNLKWIINRDLAEHSAQNPDIPLSVAQWKAVGYWKKNITKGGAWDIGRRITHLLATGNYVSRTGSIDIQQNSGFAVVADRLNFYRFVSHFRSIHRGAFFAELKTTSVRKLLPEAWGFLCPVHTPDGAPCGLLNHLSHTCKIVVSKSRLIQKPKSRYGPREDADPSAHMGDGEGYDVIDDEEEDHTHVITCMLVSFGMVPLSTIGTGNNAGGIDNVMTVTLDGAVIGWIDTHRAQDVVRRLRYSKRSEWATEASSGIPANDTKPLAILPAELEIALTMPSLGVSHDETSMAN